MYDTLVGLLASERQQRVAAARETQRAVKSSATLQVGDGTLRVWADVGAPVVRGGKRRAAACRPFAWRLRRLIGACTPCGMTEQCLCMQTHMRMNGTK